MFYPKNAGRAGALLLVVLLSGCASQSGPDEKAAQKGTTVDLEQLRQQVRDTERGFAKTMADRDFAAFSTFISDEAIFYSGPEPRRGKGQVTEFWKRFYEKPDAPFSWEPDSVEVLESGTLALSSGPVHDPSGKKIATFSSIWRQEQPGVWRIIFDKGSDVCEAPKTASQ